MGCGKGEKGRIRAVGGKCLSSAWRNEGGGGIVCLEVKRCLINTGGVRSVVNQWKERPALLSWWLGAFWEMVQLTCCTQ